MSGGGDLLYCSAPTPDKGLTIGYRSLEGMRISEFFSKLSFRPARTAAATPLACNS